MTYQEALEALRSAIPDHPLLRILSFGESAANRLILDNELRKTGAKQVDRSPIGAHVTPPEPEIDPESVDDPEDETLARLRRQQSDLFCERRKRSNSFHECFTDSQRAKVSEAIQQIQRQIEYVRRQIRDYKEHGILAGSDEKYPVPEDAFRLLALRNSLRASISRKSKEIRLLGQDVADEKAGAAEKLEKAEAKMRELQNHLQRVQKNVDDRNIQPGGLSQG